MFFSLWHMRYLFVLLVALWGLLCSGAYGGGALERAQAWANARRELVQKEYYALKEAVAGKKAHNLSWCTFIDKAQMLKAKDLKDEDQKPVQPQDPEKVFREWLKKVVMDESTFKKDALRQDFHSETVQRDVQKTLWTVFEALSEIPGFFDQTRLTGCGVAEEEFTSGRELDFTVYFLAFACIRQGNSCAHLVKQYPHLFEAIQVTQALGAQGVPFLFQSEGGHYLLFPVASGWCLGGGRPVPDICPPVRLRPEEYPAVDCSSFLAHVHDWPRDMTVAKLLACFVEDFKNRTFLPDDKKWAKDHGKRLTNTYQLLAPSNRKDVQKGDIVAYTSVREGVIGRKPTHVGFVYQWEDAVVKTFDATALDDKARGIFIIDRQDLLNLHFCSGASYAFNPESLARSKSEYILFFFLREKATATS